MKKLGVNEIREAYLSFFESKGHLRLPSYPLIPQGDKSLLLINSGMAPMKKFFTGEVEPPRHRVTTCQKCIRTPDLERVGHTARHGTFFEMLGNFSFGDYFKNEAIPWAWEFLTKVMEIPADLLWPSVYENDDEAYAIWRDVIGVPEAHIVRLGKEDNFWEHGPGPCGPCTEIYFDRGIKYGCGKPDCKPGCDCDRYMEIWNNVFSQFSNDGNGNYTELAQKNIDTGMGLERLACVIQGVDNMFEVDTVRKILDRVVAISGKEYGKDKNNDISIRVITDHVRSAMFMICDGVIPSNEGRGYVLRRIIRRACRHGKLLGIDRAFLTDVCNVAIGENVGAYPALGEKKDYIQKVLSMEEERFDATLDTGLAILNDMIAVTKADNKTEFSGKDAFKLYDTFGFPVDLTIELLDEQGLTLDRAAFDDCMNEQRVRARAATAAAGDSAWAGSGLGAVEKATEFVGYDKDTVETVVSYIFAEGEQCGSVAAGTACTLLLDESPFYAEMGGQVGDKGEIRSEAGAVFTVNDVKKTADGKWLHTGTVAAGEFAQGDKVTAAYDRSRRDALCRAHSATHLLQAALRARLGTHVAQAGSLVEPDSLRFDFTHFSAMTAEDIAAVEKQVNEWILAALPIETDVMDLNDAKATGATALFGEKYGDKVRVVRMGDCSKELCGGTHLTNTARAGMFKIVAESSVAAGVRRVEAVTGPAVLAMIDELRATIADAAAAMKTVPGDLVRKAGQLNADLSAANKEIERMAAAAVQTKVDAALANPADLGGVGFACVTLKDTGIDTVRKIGDDIRTRNDALAVLFTVTNGEKFTFAAFCTKAAIGKGLHAGNLVKAIAQMTGGNGGGRPDSATAGGKDFTKLDGAIAEAASIARSMLK